MNSECRSCRIEAELLINLNQQTLNKTICTGLRMLTGYACYAIDGMGAADQRTRYG